jgi:hypothetical protein
MVCRTHHSRTDSMNYVRCMSLEFISEPE